MPSEFVDRHSQVAVLKTFVTSSSTCAYMLSGAATLHHSNVLHTTVPVIPLPADCIVQCIAYRSWLVTSTMQGAIWREAHAVGCGMFRARSRPRGRPTHSLQLPYQDK
jgi:hypothetical protein